MGARKWTIRLTMTNPVTPMASLKKKKATKVKSILMTTMSMQSLKKVPVERKTQKTFQLSQAGASLSTLRYCRGQPLRFLRLMSIHNYPSCSKMNGVPTMGLRLEISFAVMKMKVMPPISTRVLTTTSLC